MYSEEEKCSVILKLIYNLICLIRSLWHGLLVVASFIQHVIFEVKQDDLRLKELALKHCNLQLNVCKMVLVSVFFSKLLTSISQMVTHFASGSV